MRPNTPASLQFTTYIVPEDVVSPEAAAIAAYDALPPAERVQVARLVAHTGAPLALCIAAIVALRPVELTS